MLLAARGRFPNFGPYQDPVPLAIGHIRERMGTRLTEVALSEGKVGAHQHRKPFLP